MFEGIILIIFFIVGGLAALLAIFFFVIALVRQSKAMLLFGLFTSAIPLSLYGLTYWYYDVHIPGLNRELELEYVGTYHSQSPVNSIIFVLKSDSTFEMKENKYFHFSGKGSWQAGATDDGQFEFKNGNSLLFWASPLSSGRIEIQKDGIDFIFKKE